MTTIGSRIRTVLRKVTDILPSPPSAEAPPPEADGRRPGESAEEASLHAQFQLHGSGGGSGGTIVRPARADDGPGEPR